MSFNSVELSLLNRRIENFLRKNLKVVFDETFFADLESQLTRQYNWQIFDLSTVRLKNFRKYDEILALAILCWYFPEDIRALVQVNLWNKTWPADTTYEDRRFLFTSKEEMLAWLILQDRWTESDFFGNVLNKKLLDKIRCLSLVRKPTRKVEKYTGYTRGYRDGSKTGRKLTRRPLRITSLEDDLRREEQRLLRQNRTENLSISIKRLLGKVG